MSASAIYEHFVTEVARSKRAWCVIRRGEVCLVHGGSGRFMVPLWPDAQSARYFATLCWPDLEPAFLPLRDLVGRVLVVAARQGVPAGVGLAPDPEAVIVPALRLRRDLIAARLELTGGPEGLRKVDREDHDAEGD